MKLVRREKSKKDSNTTSEGQEEPQRWEEQGRNLRLHQDFTTILSGPKSLPWDSAAAPCRSWALTRIMRSQKKVQGDLYLHVMACWWRRHIEGATEGGERTDQVSVGPKKKTLTMTPEVKDRWSETVRMWCRGRAKPDRSGIIRGRAEQWKYAIK